LGGIFLAFIPENDTLEEYVRVSKIISFLKEIELQTLSKSMKN
jgi:hypothetical protein